MEKKIRTREEVEAQIRAKNPHADNEVVEALTTLSLTGEELLADLRKRYPDTPEEALQKYAKDDEAIAHSVLDTEIELGMWESVLEEQTEGAAPQMAVEPTTLQDERDLLNSIEDEELRKELEARLYKKKLIGRGRPRKNDQLGRRMDGYDRTSLIINVEKWAKVKEIALRETLILKEIVELALDMVIDRYESKHGEVKPQPVRKRDINDIF